MLSALLTFRLTLPEIFPASNIREVAVLQLMVRILSFVALLVVAHATLAQEFSADISNLKRDSSGLSKVYVGKDQMRMEVQESKGGLGAMIIDQVKHSNIALMPDRHMYMEMSQNQIMPMAFNFWRTADANDACPQWKEMAEKVAERSKSAGKLGSCQKIGSDSVNGRSAVKYEGTDADKKKTSYVWVDTKLRYVVKVQSADGTGMEMRNIQEGSQPASLFEIPAGYTKFDMGAMMKQHPQ